MNKLFYIFLFIFFCGAVRLSAQVNLVPNPSFEIYDTCPSSAPDPGLIYFATPWFQPDTCFGTIKESSSSDYFNSCSTAFWGVPQNLLGYQFARTGNGYAGIGFLIWYPDQFGIRENIEVELLDSLRAGKKYCVEFFVSLANITGTNSLATNAIHLGFSKSIVYNNCYTPLNIQPAILNPINQIIRDTINWVKVAGEYYANGGEKFLVIGNFFSDQNSLIDSTGPAPINIAYYYIDDVSVSICDEILNVPNIFTPNGDHMNDFFHVENIGYLKFTCKLYNRWGTVVSEFDEQSNGWNGQNSDGQECPDGVYFYVILGGDDQKEFQQKGFVQLLR